MNILVVDDEEYICRLMRLVLERAGHDVIQATSMEDGLARMREEQPDVVSVDLMMPGRGGLQLLAEKQSDPALRSIPAIVVTAVGVRQDLDKALALGARAALAKPFSQRQLLDAIQEAAEA